MVSEQSKLSLQPLIEFFSNFCRKPHGLAPQSQELCRHLKLRQLTFQQNFFSCIVSAIVCSKQRFQMCFWLLQIIHGQWMVAKDFEKRFRRKWQIVELSISLRLVGIESLKTQHAPQLAYFCKLQSQMWKGDGRGSWWWSLIVKKISAMWTIRWLPNCSHWRTNSWLCSLPL